MKVSCKIQIMLAAFAAGRIVLHLMCMYRDNLVLMHLKGIAREFVI